MNVLRGVLAGVVIGGAVSACGETFTSQVNTPEGSGGKGASGGRGGNGATGGVPLGTGASPEGPDAGGPGSGGRGGGGRSQGGGASTSGGAEGTSCRSLEFESETSVEGDPTDTVTWFDAQCTERSASLARKGGGYVRQARYELDGKTRTMTGTGANGHKGWGYTVNHFEDTATSGQDADGSFEAVFVGAHHLIYRYRFAPNIANHEVPVTQEWFIATGRSHPVLATTFDVSDIEPGALVADNRTPYGDLAWNGDDNADSTVVSGVAWGDRYKFTTTSEPLTMNSSWDYQTPNIVPYVLAWETSSNAEMGAVQTQTQEQHDAGGYWFYSNWGKTSDNQTRIDGQAGVMTASWNWTYQINQYELCIDDPGCLDATTGSHRLAWGANYGAVGGVDGTGMYNAYGDERLVEGHPYLSHSVFMVLGPHEGAPTYEQVLEIERVQGARWTATKGQVVTRLPGGVGRSDEVTLEPPGYDARYSTWTFEVDSDETADVSLEGEGLDHPVLVFVGRSTLPSQLQLGDRVLQEGVDFFASLDEAGRRLFVTLNTTLSGSSRLLLD